MKVKAISQYGFKTEERPNEWNNYDKSYKEYKLVKGQDEGKDIDFTVNEKGFVNMVFLESKIPLKTTKYKNCYKTKIITSLDPIVLQDEVNKFCQEHNVKYNTLVAWNNYLVAYLIYGD